MAAGVGIVASDIESIRELIDHEREGILVPIDKTDSVRGPSVEELMHGPDGEPVLVREGNALAAAFHPELSGDLRLHRLFAECAAY